MVLLTAALFLLGCTGGFNAADLAKLDPSVQAFLAQHPNAEIKAVQIAASDFNSMQEAVSEQCEIPMAVKDYWRVKLTDTSTQLKLTVWIDSKDQKVICIVKEGQDVPTDGNGQVIPPVDTNTVVNPPVDNNTVVNPPVDNNTVVNPPVDTNNITVTPDVNVNAEPSIILAQTKITFDKIKLNSSGDGVSHVTLRIENQSDTSRSLDYQIVFQVTDDKGTIIKTDSSKKSLYKSNIVGTIFTEHYAYVSGIQPGKYYFEMAVYNEGSNVVLTKLRKEISIGPDAPAEVESIKQKEAITITPETSIGSVKVSYDKITLASGGDKIYKTVLRLVNSTETTKSIDYTLKYYMYNDQNELIDASDSQELYASTIIETEFSDKYANFSKELPLGTYTYVIKFYNIGSNKSQTYLAKKIQIGPDAPAEIVLEKPKMTTTPTTSITLGGVKTEISKVTLGSEGSSVYKVTFALENTTTTAKTIDYTVKFYFLNDKNELVDVSSDTELYKSNLSGTSEEEKYCSSTTYDLEPGTYTMVAKFYSYGGKSNTSTTYLTKQVQIGPDADQDQ
jgi:hypothetical protein